MIYLHLSCLNVFSCLFDRSMLTKHCRCFHNDTRGADGAPDLLQALSHSPLLEELKFRYCNRIPAGAWQELHGAKWLNLKTADFTECLAERNGQKKAKVFLFFSSASLSLLDVVRVQICIPACTYRCLNDLFERSMLAKHCRCFDTDTQGADGAADLLQVLSHSKQLEKLIFDDCSQIPAAAWQKVPDGAWPKLRWARGIPEEELRRLRGHGELEGRTEGDPCRHDPSEGREEEDQR